ncbi:MAG TPA: thioredoxin fold domain-containing protein [Xanthomonadaceae bacterium]|nr:thioredoxin fold domain-containing protein [Xanthomonadaceae bacterium]
MNPISQPRIPVLRRLLPTTLCVALAVASLTACAQEQDAAADAAETAAKPAAPGAETAYPAGSPEANAREAIRSIAPKLQVDRVADAPIDGFQQVVVGGQVVYVTDDGRYLLQGTLLDVAAREDLNEAAMSDLRRELLAAVPEEDRIVFAPKDPEYTVSVFTDVDCGYCRKLHGEMADYNAQGIAVEYLAFPRMGPGSENFDEMVSVWCADDRREALTRAKAGGEVTGGDCTSPVAMQYALGQRLGLTGTPMILAPDGSQLGGYVPPQQLRAMLDERAAKASTTTPGPAGAADTAASATP